MTKGSSPEDRLQTLTASRIRPWIAMRADRVAISRFCIATFTGSPTEYRQVCECAGRSPKSLGLKGKFRQWEHLLRLLPWHYLNFTHEHTGLTKEGHW